MNPGAQTLQVDLQKTYPDEPWGFRLQGGSDFTTPLSIQLVGQHWTGGEPQLTSYMFMISEQDGILSVWTPEGVGAQVNPGSLAEGYGLRPNDAVLAINGIETDALEHEQAKWEIQKAGNCVSLVIIRGALTTWKPKVTPMSELRPENPQLDNLPMTDYGDPYLQKTSLAASKMEPLRIGSAHNRTARPFPGFGVGSSAGPGTVGQSGGYGGGYQYGQEQDTMAQHAAQTYGAQHQATESQGSTNNNSATQVPARAPHNSVLTDSTTFTPAPNTNSQLASEETGLQKQSRSFQLLQQELQQEEAGGGGARPAGMRSVKAPTAKPASERPQQVTTTCHICGSLIIGVFVKIRGNPIHAECFKCRACGKNLKNQGHYFVGEDMYCDVCVRNVARPSDPNAELVFR